MRIVVNRIDRIVDRRVVDRDEVPEGQLIKLIITPPC